MLVTVVNRSKDTFVFSADDEVNEIFNQHTGTEFEIKGMNANCFKMQKDTKYGVLPKLK